MCRQSKPPRSRHYTRHSPSHRAWSGEDTNLTVRGVWSIAATPTCTDHVLLKQDGVHANGPRFLQSCSVRDYKPHNHEQQSEPHCQPRTWTSHQTYSGGTPPPKSSERIREHSPASGSSPSLLRQEVDGSNYFATVLDCHTKKNMGYVMAHHIHTPACQAIKLTSRLEDSRINDNMMIFN